MPDISVDPDALRTEAKKWARLAGDMSTIRQDTANLSLGVTAFFPGGMTEGVHHTKYRDCLDRIVSRLEGAAIEYELIGFTLNKIASDYEEEERVTQDSFRVTREEVDRATATHSPPAYSGAGNPSRFE